MRKSDSILNELIKTSLWYSKQNKYSDAIYCLEIARTTAEEDSELANKYLDDILWYLGNLYGTEKKDDLAIEVMEIQLQKFLDKFEDFELTTCRLSDDENASKIISICLNLGKAYFNIGEIEKAKNRNYLGYILSFCTYGEYDCRTLKQALNIAGVELLNGDESEGLRQIMYCYYDMREYLGEKNEYTQHVENILRDYGKCPEELYESYIEKRELCKQASAIIAQSYCPDK